MIEGDGPLPRGADRALRFGAVALALGAGAQLVSEPAHPVREALAGGPAASFAEAAPIALTVALAAAACLSLTGRARLGMASIAAVAICVDIAAMKTAAGGALLVPICHASRWLAPLAFVAATSERPDALRRARTLLALATAATFAGHGIKAFQAPPNFVAYLDCAFRITTGSTCPADVTADLLVGIGVIDLLVAALVLAGRPWLRPALVWMVAWGAATAVVRIAHGGLEAWPLTAERVLHAAAPLALLLLLPTARRGAPSA